MATDSVELDPLLEVDLGEPVRQLRVVPVQLSPDEPNALLLIHSGHPNVDPYANLFTIPDDTLKFTLVTQDGTVRWTRDLGPGIVPGIWFCPVFPFDLDGDGADEIWYVDTDDPDHPLSLDGHRLARLDPKTGETTATWDWPTYPRETLTNTYRNVILGGHVDGEPVLVTTQGTYGKMQLQAWNPNMSRRWDHEIPADARSARGSHMTPVLDVDGDGVDELLWGERLLELDTGIERYCADRDTWGGHSDIVQPTLDHESGEWYVYTCREQLTDQPPRVVTYDADGERVWAALDEGHMHVGWTARLGDDGRRIAMAGRSKGDGYEGLDEFGWEAFTGEPVEFDYPVYSTWPVDLDGDGVHELVYRDFGRGGRVVDSDGDVLGEADTNVAKGQPSKLLPHPGEQFATFTEDGAVRVWGDRNAEDSDEARARYEHPYYEKAQRLSAVGYNWRNVAGL